MPSDFQVGYLVPVPEGPLARLVRAKIEAGELLLRGNDGEALGPERTVIVKGVASVVAEDGALELFDEDDKTVAWFGTPLYAIAQPGF